MNIRLKSIAIALSSFLLIGQSISFMSQQIKPKEKKTIDTVTINLGEIITLYVDIQGDVVTIIDLKKGSFKEKDTLVLSFFETDNGPNLTIENQTGRVLSYRSYRMLNGQLLKNHPVPSVPDVLGREMYRDKCNALILSFFQISDFDREFQAAKPNVKPPNA